MSADLDAAPGREPELMLPTGSVFWACIHGQDVRGGFMSSVVGLLTSPYADLIGSFYDLASGPVLSIARNQAAKDMLATGMEWLWFVDCDTVFRPDVLPRLMMLADPAARPVMACAYPIAGPSPSREFSGIPDLFWAAYRYASPGALEPLSCAAPVAEVERVDAVGTGCVLIHRSVFEAIGPGPFNEFSDGDTVLGEDLSFCRRADQLGIPLHFASRVRVGHAKVVVL